MDIDNMLDNIYADIAKIQQEETSWDKYNKLVDLEKVVHQLYTQL